MMQFPYPRKSSQPPTYSASRYPTYAQRRNLKRLAVYLSAGLTGLLFLVWLVGSSDISSLAPAGTPKAVLVTTIDPSLSETHITAIQENRRDYAARHGYVAFTPNATDYDLGTGTPLTWAQVPALRHALTLWPHTPWLFYLSSTALIMNPRESLEDKILEPKKMESLMIMDKPVVPPDSVIKTFSHLVGERVGMVVTQDTEGIAGGSMLIRNADWAKFFLDAWFDPLYRSYNFQKAEGHALEHIVQWHGTILAKLALVPQRILNSYSGTTVAASSQYQEGDFVANLHGCRRDPARDCEREMGPLVARWRELRDQEARRR